jgi:S-adenosylmethionine-diacylgycerolhomoserine-N-methlytransferase
MAVRHVAPGGSLHIVDFGQCENLPPLVRRALFAWLDRFHVTPRENLRAALEGLAGRNGGTLRFEPLMGGYAWHGVVRLAP